MVEAHTDCRGSVVAGDAGLRHRIEGRVIENATHVECPDTVTSHAVHARLRVGLCFPGRVNAIVTGVATTCDGAVIDVRGQECVRRVAEAALRLTDKS